VGFGCGYIWSDTVLIVETQMTHYDITIIGTGPAGLRWHAYCKPSIKHLSSSSKTMEGPSAPLWYHALSRCMGQGDYGARRVFYVT
jgi:hypothetical protein